MLKQCTEGTGSLVSSTGSQQQQGPSPTESHLSSQQGLMTSHQPSSGHPQPPSTCCSAMMVARCDRTRCHPPCCEPPEVPAYCHGTLTIPSAHHLPLAPGCMQGAHAALSPGVTGLEVSHGQAHPDGNGWGLSLTPLPCRP
jgi:hypothetical protein